VRFAFGKLPGANMTRAASAHKDFVSQNPYPAIHHHSSLCIAEPPHFLNVFQWVWQISRQSRTTLSALSRQSHEALRLTSKASHTETPTDSHNIITVASGAYQINLQDAPHRCQKGLA
ncbi:MAG: hypothetical protein WA156_07900, partial [Methylocystis silviterrae]